MNFNDYFWEDYPKIKANPNLTVGGYNTEANRGMNLITRDNSAIPLIAKDGIHFKMNDYSELY